MNHIYLDSNILIAYYATDEAEESKKAMVVTALNTFAKLQHVQLCTSMWAVSEAINILISRKRMERASVADIESRLVNEKRMCDLKIQFVDVSPKKSYDFVEFFFHVRQDILQYHSGVGDIIHNVIMRNHGISTILTFDEKTDFKQIPGLTVLHPKNVKL